MLILAGTPIGNLEDISHRLERTLREADQIFAEDTRHTRKLLQHLAIAKRPEAFHEHSGEADLQRVRRALQHHDRVVYVSDGGMPGISDPGYELITLALEMDVEVDVIPGPCAAINALLLSGLPNHQYGFMGFFPTRPERKRSLIEKLSQMAMTTVHYEAPSRIQHTLDYLEETLGNQPMALCREMTKLHQEVLRGTPSQIKQALSVVKGEMALVIGPVEQLREQITLEERCRQLLEEGNSPSKAAKIAAGEFRIAKKEAYATIQALNEPESQ